MTDYWQIRGSVMVVARVYQGMWIADCVRDACANAEVLPMPDENYEAFRLRWPANRCIPECFVCTNCGLQSPILWPENHRELMDPLALRPVPQTRNWLPGETVTDLWLENADHGIGA
jgi:hypothetical protein